MLPQHHPELQQLKDIYLPETISLWPPSIALTLATLLAITILLTCAYHLVKWYRSRALKRAAMKALQSIDREKLSLEDQLNALATLVRRISISRFEHQKVAPLTGSEWLAFLDYTYDPSGKANLFRVGSGRFLGSERYQPNLQLDKNQMTEIRQLIKDWIVRVC